MLHWRCIKAVHETKPLIEWLKTVPDPRCGKKVKHELAEVFICIIMGFLAGKTKLRRIVRWSQDHIDDLRKRMPFPDGAPSLSTISRVLSALDEEMVSLAITNWIGGIVNTRGRHRCNRNKCHNYG